jgi:hypothetical protein
VGIGNSLVCASGSALFHPWLLGAWDGPILADAATTAGILTPAGNLGVHELGWNVPVGLKRLVSARGASESRSSLKIFAGISVTYFLDDPASLLGLA